jgi:L-threonylcarbamoyladenylate synthase
MKSKTLSWQRLDDIKKVALLLLEGYLVVGSTDTVPGLFAAVTPAGVEALNDIKMRTHKPYLLLVQSYEKSLDYIQRPISIQAENIMRRCWPGPVTLILPIKKEGALYAGVSGDGVALRVPKHEGLQKLLEMTGPLFSTSANISGNATATSVEQLDPFIADRVAALIDGSAQENKHEPSTMLDCMQPQIRVVRVGAYPIAQLQEIAGSSFINS